MSAELKACPFCGGEAFARSQIGFGITPEERGAMMHYVCCHAERCDVAPMTALCVSADAAIAAWNHRPDAARVAGGVVLPAGETLQTILSQLAAFGIEVYDEDDPPEWVVTDINGPDGYVTLADALQKCVSMAIHDAINGPEGYWSRFTDAMVERAARELHRQDSVDFVIPTWDDLPYSEQCTYTARARALLTTALAEPQ